MRNVFGWSVIGVLSFSAIVSAQQVRPGVQPAQPAVRPGQPGVVQPGTVRPGVVQPGATNQASQSNDQQIAAVIAQCNQNEVAFAKWAINKVKSNEAKEIATMMIKDHSEGAETFAKLAGHYGASIRSEGGQDRDEGRREEGRREDRREERDGDRNRDSERSDASDAKAATPARENAATAPNNPGTRVIAQATPNAAAQAPTAQNPAGQAPAGGQPRVALRPVAGGGLDWVTIHQEIGDECLSETKKELGKYEGNEFDKAFLGKATASHMGAAAALRVFRRHASAQLASEIDSALSTTEDHLKHIKEAMEEKKDEGNK